MINLLDDDKKSGWVKYPKEYLELIEVGHDEFLPWYLMDKDQISIRLNGLKKRYPNRTLFPFARDDRNDDMACWEKNKPGKVVLIHDFASSGYENKEEFSSFSDWYTFVNN